MNLWLGALKVSHHPAKFGDHIEYINFGSEDIVILVHHVIWESQEIKASCDFMGRSHSW